MSGQREYVSYGNFGSRHTSADFASEVDKSGTFERCENSFFRHAVTGLLDTARDVAWRGYVDGMFLLDWQAF